MALVISVAVTILGVYSGFSQVDSDKIKLLRTFGGYRGRIPGIQGRHGYLIVYGGQVFRLDRVMTSVIILSLAAAAMYQGVVFLEKFIIKWQ